MGLYDIMSDLIHSPASQDKIHDYFEKNKDEYPFVSFAKSRKNPNKSEDSFTHLRNAIAHSKQIGIKNYLDISNGISEGHIKHLLIVLNDLLCSVQNER